MGTVVAIPIIKYSSIYGTVLTAFNALPLGVVLIGYPQYHREIPVWLFCVQTFDSPSSSRQQDEGCRVGSGLRGSKP